MRKTNIQNEAAFSPISDLPLKKVKVLLLLGEPSNPHPAAHIGRELVVKDA